MNILILGSGGREHTLTWKIAQSKNCKALYVAPGNSGTAMHATNLDIGVNDFEGIAKAVTERKIDMVIVGPEDPLVNGIHDYLKSHKETRHVAVIGPEKKGAQLEGSKQFAKEFMQRHGIPTAAYSSFTAETLKEGQRFLETLKPPYVLKADGLAAGKGVLILQDLEQAKTELKAMLTQSKFGDASKTVVIEEFLDGIELSCFVLTDGRYFKILPMAKDYKRIGEGDTGLNTGGMGAVSPVPFADEAFRKKILERIVKPTIDGLAEDDIPYVGFVFIGLIKVGDDPFVIEYNVRMGDPETEVVLPRLKSDLLEILMALDKGELDSCELQFDERAAATVMLVSGGYPQAYEKGKAIKGLDKVTDSIVFHAGAKKAGDEILSSGGRVIAITSYGDDIKKAIETSYASINRICFEGMYYRKDIGFDL